MIEVSLILSTFNRLGLTKRTLYAIARRPPSLPYEVVMVDDGSTDDLLSELHLWDSVFRWQFIRFDAKEFAQKTGLEKFHNNPSVTNNIGLRYSRGRYLFQQGQEVIPWSNCYDQMIREMESPDLKRMVFSTTYDIPPLILENLDNLGTNINEKVVQSVTKWPLQSPNYRAEVSNYLALWPKRILTDIGGYDERYFAGISAEDSDFSRRARHAGYVGVYSTAVSLHQSHSGKTMYYDPPPSLISKESWDEGVRKNHAIYHAWDHAPQIMPQHTWESGSVGVKEVITN